MLKWGLMSPHSAASPHAYVPAVYSAFNRVAYRRERVADSPRYMPEGFIVGDLRTLLSAGEVSALLRCL